MIARGLFLLSLALTPGLANAAGLDVVAYNCIFPRDASSASGPKFDYFAVLLPDWLKPSRGTPFEVIDPSHLLNGGRLSTLMAREGSFALAGSPSDAVKMLLVSTKTEKSGVWDAVLGDRSAPVRRTGQCAALGEKAEETFAFWKKHPDRIGDAP